MDNDLPSLCNVECEVMTLVCAEGPIAADTVRVRLPGLPDKSKIPTLLRRLEEKGYIAHVVEGRTALYWAKQPRGQAVANCRELQLLAEAIRQAKSWQD
jgi:predicted transcriptional regulator